MGGPHEEGIDFSGLAEMHQATILSALIPPAVMAAVYLEAMLVRLSVGRLPDPDSLPQPLAVMDTVVTIAFLLLYPLTVLAAILACLSLLYRFRSIRAASLAWLAATGVVLVMFLMDPGGIFSWLMD